MLRFMQSGRRTYGRLRLALTMVAVIALAGLSVRFANAQGGFGSLVGTITDPTGAVIPGANVVLTNIGTNEARKAQSNAAGDYRFVDLLPANYRLEIEVSGFKRLTREPINVEVGSAVRIDGHMEVGAVSETVAVTSETPLLQTESSSVSDAIEGRHVLEMPLNGRNSMNLIALVPGVVPQGSTAGNPAGNQTSNQTGSHTAQSGWNNYQIGGGIAGQSVNFLDGAPLNEGGGGNSLGFVTTQDAVQEFRVVTNNVSPEFGRFSGGVINMTTKSGTNGFHGSVYEFLRNKVLNANNFFSASQNQKQSWEQNQYGATLGGPIRKDKTFFFFSWENYSLRFGIPTYSFVPTDEEKGGNFAADPPIYDPLTTQVVNNQVTRTQFQSNQIPSSRIDPAANVMANVLKYWPSPNTNSPSGNFFSEPEGGANSTQYNARIDQNITDKQRLFARYTYMHEVDVPFDPLLNGITSGAANHITGQQAVLGDTVTFSPTTVAEVRLSYLRQFVGDTAEDQNVNLAQFSPAFANLASQVQYPLIPNPLILGGIRTFPAAPVNQINYWNTYALSANLTKIIGRHSINFGGEIRLMDNIGSAEGEPAGLFLFNAGFTSADNNGFGSTGDPFASFMLGYPFQGQANKQAFTAAYSWYQGYYFADTFQASRNLTVNYGVRWELPGALAERHDLDTVLLPNAADPLSQSTGLNLKGQLGLVNSPLWPHRTVPVPSHDLFAPRVGLAYRLDDASVLSAGYGITYLPNNYGGGAPSSSPINASVTNMVTSLNGLVPYNTLSDPFPANGIPGTVQQALLSPPGRSSAYLTQLEGSNISGMLGTQSFPYTQQWNLSLQHQFTGSTLFALAYTGAKGTHLPDSSGIDLDQLPDQYDSLGVALTTSVLNPFYGLVPATNALGGPTTTEGQLLRPYPQFTSVQANGTQFGSTTYHAGIARVEKRFGDGGVLSGNYTWAKIIGNVDTAGASLEFGSVGTFQDYDNLRADRSLLSNDVRQRGVISYALDLPFGKGRRFLGATKGPVGQVISGWGVNGITTFQSGFPLAFTAQATTLSSSFGAGTPRPNVAAGCATKVSGSGYSRVNNWFNTGCFSQPGPFSFGNESRVDSSLRASGIDNFDFALFKNTGITEGVKLQFRAEVFNLFNRVQFAPPDTTVGDTGFGAVPSQVNTPRLVQLALRLNF